MLLAFCLRARNATDGHYLTQCTDALLEAKDLVMMSRQRIARRGSVAGLLVGIIAVLTKEDTFAVRLLRLREGEYFKDTSFWLFDNHAIPRFGISRNPTRNLGRRKIIGGCSFFLGKRLRPGPGRAHNLPHVPILLPSRGSCCHDVWLLGERGPKQDGENLMAAVGSAGIARMFFGYRVVPRPTTSDADYRSTLPFRGLTCGLTNACSPRTWPIECRRGRERKPSVSVSTLWREAEPC